MTDPRQGPFLRPERSDPLPDGFSSVEYEVLHDLVFSGVYPGYRPAVAEAPNGDGHVDREKRYAHIALKYIAEYPGSAEQRGLLQGMLTLAHAQAECVAEALGCPAAFLPDVRYGALRVLEYPEGAGSNRHTDFDLFTLHLYKSRTHGFQRPYNGGKPIGNANAIALNPGLHVGEIGELVGLGAATPHYVDPAPAGGSYSIVYFAIPDHTAVLPSGQTVGAWIAERIARSRIPA